MRVPRHIIREMKAIVGSENLLCDPAELAAYDRDASSHEATPDLVALPATTDEVRRVMMLASANSIPMVPRGAGSGVTGGCVAVKGGIVIGLARMDRIHEIDPENHVARVGPGVINHDLRLAAERLDLYYPPDPASLKFCTLGGNVATGAGGPSAVKYGVTRDYVRSIEAVLPDGRLIQTGVRTAKGVAGYDLCRLLVGSEGTLALFTEITLALIPRPRARAVILLTTTSARDAARLVAPILQVVTPSALEFLDHTAVNLVAEQLPEAPTDTTAVLLIELDGDHDTVAIQERLLADFLGQQKGVTGIFRAADDEEAEKLRQARRSLSPASFSLNPDKINEDVVVARSDIPVLVDFVHQLGRDLAIPVFTFGHAGDGNLHVNIMIDRADPRQNEAGKEARSRLFRQVIRMGGTITGEHGVGISKKNFLTEEIDGAALDIMGRIKKAFDPEGLLNPGKILNTEGI